MNLGDYLDENQLKALSWVMWRKSWKPGDTLRSVLWDSGIHIHWKSEERVDETAGTEVRDVIARTKPAGADLFDVFRRKCWTIYTHKKCKSDLWKVLLDLGWFLSRVDIFKDKNISTGEPNQKKGWSPQVWIEADSWESKTPANKELMETRSAEKIEKSSFDVHYKIVTHNGWQDCWPVMMLDDIFDSDWYFVFENYNSNSEILHYESWDVHYYLIARCIDEIDRRKNEKIARKKGYYVVDSQDETKIYWPYPVENSAKIKNDFWKFVDEEILKHKEYKVWDIVTFRCQDGSSQTIKITQIVGDTLFGTWNSGWWWYWCDVEDVISVVKK